MGKKKPLVNDHYAALMDPSANKSIEKRYGISYTDYAYGRPGGGGIQKKDPRQYGADLAAAATNDYDTRRSMEMSALGGNEDATKFAKDGFAGAEDVRNAHEHLKGLHKEYDLDGKYGAQGGFEQLTHHLVQEDRKTRDADFDQRFGDLTTAQEELRNKQESMSAASASAEPYEPSERAKAALGETEFKPIDRGLGDQSLAYDPNAGIQDKDAGEFLNNYKQDIQAGVKKSGAQPRGMMSIHNRF